MMKSEKGIYTSCVCFFVAIFWKKIYGNNGGYNLRGGRFERILKVLVSFLSVYSDWSSFRLHVLSCLFNRSWIKSEHSHFAQISRKVNKYASRDNKTGLAQRVKDLKYALFTHRFYQNLHASVAIF